MRRDISWWLSPRGKDATAAGFTPAVPPPRPRRRIHSRRAPAANQAIEVATFRSEPHELANWKAISTVELPCS